MRAPFSSFTEASSEPVSMAKTWLGLTDCSAREATTSDNQVAPSCTTKSAVTRGALMGRTYLKYESGVEILSCCP